MFHLNVDDGGLMDPQGNGVMVTENDENVRDRLKGLVKEALWTQNTAALSRIMDAV